MADILRTVNWQRGSAVIKRYPLLIEAVIATMLFVASVGAQTLPLPLPQQLTAHLSDWQVFTLVGLACFGMLLERRLPRFICLLAIACNFLMLSHGAVTGFTSFVVLFVLFFVAARYPLWQTVFFGVIATAWPWVGVIVAVGEPPDFLRVLSDLIFVGTAIAFGRVHWQNTQRAEKLQEMLQLLEDAQQRLADEAVNSERTRIAREMHDIVAHSLGIIVVRSGVARALLAEHPDQARQALQVIESISRESLAEMRNVLKALRDPAANGGGNVEVHPQPGLDRLAELLQTMSSSGLSIELHREGRAYELPAGQDLTAYRIVQEALTNVLKHAGPAANVHLTLRYVPSYLEIDVLDHGRPSRVPALAGLNGSGKHAVRDYTDTERQALPALPRSGQGLVGMRERVLLYGGSLRAYPLVHGGFRVTAVLPRSAQDAAREEDLPT
ncbi:sensor histidine kinase [Pseudonocardiaceae bacterium YIM PH 21723]|nr:sensor histidine kinase [Pseudonocardiaceae bacterium YIM PH 21723]